MAATIKQRIELEGGKELKRELEEFGAAGRKAFKDLQAAAAQTKGLSPGFFNSLKQAEVQIKSLAKSFEDAGKRIQTVGRTLTTNLTLPIVGLGVGILKQAADFQTAMNSFAVNAGVAGKALEDAKTKAQELGQASVFSSTEAAQGMTELAKVGLDFQTIMGGAAKAMVDLAAANDTGLANSASIVGDVINQFKLTAGQLPAIVNQITGATIESKLSIDDYRLAIGQAGGAAGALGVSFGDFNAVLAATASSFASGSDAGTSFKTFLTRLVPQSKQAAAAMEKLGLKFFDANGKMKSMSEIAQILQDKLGKLSQEDLTDNVQNIFGTDAMRTAIALMKQGGKGIDEMSAKLKNTDSAEIAATRVKGLWGEIDQLKSALENLSIAIGASGFLDFATNIVIALTDWTQALATLSPDVLKFGTIIGSVVASIGPLLFTLGLMTRGFGVTLQGVSSLIGGFRLLSAALLFLGANPIIAALALVGVAIGIWATRASEATAALRIHEELIGKVGNAYDQAGRKVDQMTQAVKDQALIQTRLSQDAANKGLSSAIDEAIASIQQFDGLLPHAADQLFEVFKQFAATKDVEAFRTEVAKIGAASPELGKLAQQFLDISENAHKLNQDSQESANFIGLLTGKFTDAEFAAKQAALGIAGYGTDTVAATTKANAALDETAKKVEALHQTVTVSRPGANGPVKEVFDLVDGVVRSTQKAKEELGGLQSSMDETAKTIDGVGASAEKAFVSVTKLVRTNEAVGSQPGSHNIMGRGSRQEGLAAIPAEIQTQVFEVGKAVDDTKAKLGELTTSVRDGAAGTTEAIQGVSNEITNSIVPAAQEAAAGVAEAFAGIDGDTVAAAIVAPFEALPGTFSDILAGVRSLLQSGFASLSATVRQLAAQIQQQINSILAALRQAAAQAASLRSQAASGRDESGGPGFASGGHVRGAGGPKTDSILAWLSNGEFVMQAAAVKKFGVGFLSALNNGFMPSLKGLKGFSLGGFADGLNRSMSQLAIPRLAGGGMALASAGGGGGQPLHLHLPNGETIVTTVEMSPGEVAGKLVRYAVGATRRSTGKKPTWFG